MAVKNQKKYTYICVYIHIHIHILMNVLHKKFIFLSFILFYLQSELMEGSIRTRMYVYPRYIHLLMNRFDRFTGIGK